jgi:hypothetical protein
LHRRAGGLVLVITVSVITGLVITVPVITVRRAAG